MRLLLIRHGETEWNRLGKLQGQTNTPLGLIGISQAKKLSHFLKERPIEAVYSSDLFRASDTADPIAQALGKSLEVDTRMRPRHIGIFQGETWLDIERKYPDVVEKYTSGDPSYAVPNGETFANFDHRTNTFFQELTEQYEEDQSVVVVTHGAVLGKMFRQVLQIPLNAPRRFRSRNTAVNEFVFNDDHWFLEVFGDVRHLEEQSLDDLDD